MNFIPNFEWEYLQNEINYDILKMDIKGIEFNFSMCKNFSVKRNEKYEIKGFIRGTYKNNLEYKILLKLSNSSDIQNFIIETDYEVITLCAESLLLSLGYYKNFEIFLDVINIQSKTKENEEKEVAYLKEWYLNGPKNIDLFYRKTEYSLIESFVKERNNLNNDYNNIFEFIESNKIELLDFLYIQPKVISNFFIQTIPKELCPFWSNCLVIEYNSELGFPNKFDREKIYEIVSFIFGRNLIKVGESKYDKNGVQIEEFAFKPDLSSKIDLRGVCQSKDLNPIYYGKDNYSKIEEDLELLLNNYNDLDVNLNFSNIFYYIFNSMIISEGSSIIVMYSALDNLINSWLKIKDKDSRSHLKQRQYKKLLCSELNIIKEKLINYPDVYKRIENAYIRPPRKRDDFFNANKLELGDLEKSAIEFRHKLAHGMEMSEEDRNDIIKFSLIFRTLLNRCILKVLKYNGDYYDLYFEEHRNIYLSVPNDWGV